jgi:hypothetical protein
MTADLSRRPVHRSPAREGGSSPRRLLGRATANQPPSPPDDDDDKPKAPETPPDEPRPQPVQDPPDELPEKGPYTVH